MTPHSRLVHRGRFKAREFTYTFPAGVITRGDQSKPVWAHRSVCPGIIITPNLNVYEYHDTVATRDVKYWTLTHEASGLAVTTAGHLSLREARIACGVLLGTGVDWTQDAKTVETSARTALQTSGLWDWLRRGLAQRR